MGLFKNVQMQGAQKAEPRGLYGYTLSGAVCSATQQLGVFQQPPPRVAILRYTPAHQDKQTSPAGNYRAEFQMRQQAM